MHMRDAAREAFEYSKGRSREEMDSDRMLMHAMVRCIEIVGEAANRVSADCQSSLSLIAWEDIIGMRNRLAHGYFDVNLTIVWRTVTEELPGLIAHLEEALAE
jgi:uncharacterized protein with HEPN domain